MSRSHPRRPFVTSPGWADPPADRVLPPGAIHVFAFTLETSKLEDLRRLLSRDEAARADAFKRPTDAMRFVVGRATTRTILAAYLGQQASQLRFAYDVHGKPRLDATDAPHFNLSGSHDLGVLAFQLKREVGIDVERLRPLPNALTLAERYFTPQEYAALESLPAAQVDPAFFSLWTRKEAVVKSLGRGLAYPMNAFSLVLAPSESAERVLVEGQGSQWVLQLPSPLKGHVAAVATAADDVEVTCFNWSDP